MSGFTVNSRHAEDLAGGRTVARGEQVPAKAVDPKDPHDARLIDEGVLVPRAKDKLTGQALKDRAEEFEIEGRSEMRAEQLRAAVAKAEEEQNQ